MVAYVLSVSNRSRGPRAGGKSKAPKKKAKSEFQGRKKHSVPVKEVDKGDTSVDPGDAKILKVSLPSLSPGTYTVIWQVTSVDTHKTEGKFTFKVVP